MKYMKILRNSFLAIGFSLFLVSCGGGGTTGREAARLTRLDGDTFNFIVANDLGRNGYYDQKPIAEQMGQLAEEIDIEFVAAAGDIHHFEGVASVEDPLWMTDYELVYSHPELMGSNGIPSSATTSTAAIRRQCWITAESAAGG